MAYKLDRIDREIVNCLRHNSRMPCARIAEQIGCITERAVRYRLDRLVHLGIVDLTAVVNPASVGCNVIADVWLEVEPGRVMEVAHKLVEMDEISYVACSTGDRDISVQIQARDNNEFYTFVTQVLGRIPGVRKTMTMVVPVILKHVYDWPIPLSACYDGNDSAGEGVSEPSNKQQAAEKDSDDKG